jgi:cyclophilin family peptidyl-prolyl cis-trans isomerase
MPYTVYFFLSQVEKELFNGCSFHRNAGHVMQAGPAPNFKTPPNAGLMRRFQESMLESVSFQEYSANYPHLPYTLGYAGRPGGPDFYISVEDNSKIHGPGGQGSYEDPTEADPCFATVVEGREAVDRMVKTEVQPGGYRHMVHNVNIRYMKILK